MDEIKFESTLSEEEIIKNFEGTDLFSGIMSGLEEALACEKSSTEDVALSPTMMLFLW